MPNELIADKPSIRYFTKSVKINQDCKSTGITSIRIMQTIMIL